MDSNFSWMPVNFSRRTFDNAQPAAERPTAKSWIGF